MKLNEQIRSTIADFRQALTPELSALVEQGAGEISALEIVEKALTVGDAVEDFALSNHQGESRRLSEYLGDGPLVLTFYRGLWCPYCNLQLAAYNAVLKDIQQTGANLVALNPEGPVGADIVKKSNLPQEAKTMIVQDPDFDVLHDKDNTVARRFGLVFDLPDAHQTLLKAVGIDLENNLTGNAYAFADPATYIVGTDAKIKWAFVPNNYRKRAEPDILIQQLQTLSSQSQSDQGENKL